MISSQKSILWPYQYSLSISTTSPISRYLEAAIIWDVKIYIVKCCKKKDKKQSPVVFRFHGFPGELERGCRRCGVSIPEHKSSISIVFIFFLWRGREGAVTYVHLWMKPSHTMQCNGLLTLTWQNLPTFGTLRARWLSLPQTRSCSQRCAEIEAAAEFQVKQEHNWKCDRYIHIVAMFF